MTKVFVRERSLVKRVDQLVESAYMSIYMRRRHTGKFLAKFNEGMRLPQNFQRPLAAKLLIEFEKVRAVR